MTTQLSPDSPPNPVPVNLPGQKPGPFIQVMGEAFMLLGRYFVVIYPIFLYFILRSFIAPKALPNYQHWEWWVVSLGFIAIWFLLEAGWHAMTCQAVKLYEAYRLQTISADTPPEAVFPFALLRAFIPGIGEYGLSFLIGGFLNILLFAIPAGVVVWLGYRFIGIPKAVLPFMASQAFDAQQLQKAFMTASPYEQMQLAMWDGLFWAVLLLIFLVTNLTMYWRPYVLLKQISPPKAFIRSIVYIFKHPLLTLKLMTLSIILGIVAATLASLSSWTALIGFFLLILTMLYLQFMLYLILYRTDGIDPTPAA